MRIELDGVSLAYKSEPFPALNSVSDSFDEERPCLLLGPTGAGKTSLMRLLYGDLKPTAGIVRIDGVDIHRLGKRRLAALRRRMGIVYQDCKLFDDLTVYENVVIQMYAVGHNRREADKRGLRVLGEVGISYLRNRMPSSLSGGEKHLAALARAIVHEPEMLFADEPTSNMDDLTMEAVVRVLNEVHGKGCGLVLATHSQTMLDAFPEARHLYVNEGSLSNTPPEAFLSMTNKGAAKSE